MPSRLSKGSDNASLGIRVKYVLSSDLIGTSMGASRHEQNLQRVLVRDNEWFWRPPLNLQARRAEGKTQLL